MDSKIEIFEKVTAQGNTVRQLKAEKAGKDDVLAAVEVLKQLKLEYKNLTGHEYQAGNHLSGWLVSPFWK